MSSVNKAIIVGNLGSDPEIRSTQDGKKIANFSVATSEKWKDKSTGEKKENTQWHRIVIFNEKLSEVAEQYLKKGSKVFIEGAMQTRKWTDNNGIERYVTEVIIANYRGNLVMLDGKNDSSSGGVPPHMGENQPDHNSNSDSGYSSEEYKNKEMKDEGFPDDEIPF